MPFGGYQILMFGDFQQLKCVGDFEIFKPQTMQTVNEIQTAMEIIEETEDGAVDEEEFEADVNFVTNKQMDNMFDMGGVMYDDNIGDIQIMDPEAKKKSKLADKKKLIETRLKR